MKDWDNDVESIFNQESRDKKRIGSNVYKRASRRGYVGTMRTPYDLMNRSDKKAYSKGSEITVSNIYAEGISNIPSWEEIQKMPVEKQFNIVSIAIDNYTKKALREHWKVSHNKLYMKILKPLGLFDGDFTKKKEKPTVFEIPLDKKQEEAKAPILDRIVNELKQSTVVFAEKESSISLEDSFTLTFNRQMTGLEVLRRMEQISAALDNKTEYKLELKITEVLNR